MGKVHPAYVAGFLDGDGCILISKSNGSKRYRSENYYLKVSFSNNILEPLLAIKDGYGGNIHPRELPEGNVAYALDLFADDAAKLLKDVSKYLIIKKKHAELALEYRSKITKCKPAPRKRVPEEEINLRRSYHERMKQLNKLTKGEIKWL